MSPAQWEAISLSLKVGLWSAAVGIVPSVFLGWLLGRGRFLGRSLLNALVLFPLVMPPVVTGLLLLDVFGRSATLGKVFVELGLPLSFGFPAAVLAAFVVGLPLNIFACRAAFEAVDPQLEEMAMTLGYSPLKTFWKVSFPLALPGIGAGAVLAFARGLGEFGATSILAGDIQGETRTIALAVYQLLQSPGGENETRGLVAASICLSVFALLMWDGLNRWQRRRLEVDRD